MDSFEIIQRTNKEKTYVVNAVDTDINRLPYMESLYGQAKDQVDKMQRTRQGLENDIEDRKNKISLLDKIAFSCEQECKKAEQRVEDLTDQKHRIE
jgi:septal ring factor EnvC (AmiA/AmiB activator)